MSIGIAGLGRMGTIFASRLIDAGLPLTVWNRTQSKVEPLSRMGASVAATPAQLVQNCDIVMTSIAGEEALISIMEGYDGILSADLGGRIIVDTSTVMPDFVTSLGSRIVERGGAMVDAPILGTTGPARAGMITVVAGGPVDAVEKVMPVFAHLARHFFHIGPSGQGSTMKLVVIMHLCAYWQSLAEALRMGGSNGLSPDAMLEVLLSSPVATDALRSKMSIIRGETNEVGYDIAGVCNVLQRSLELADRKHVETPATRSAMAGFSAISASGRQDHDVVQLVLDALTGK